MGLPQSPTMVLAGLANGGNCALVVDQVDAVSQISGRYPHLWDVFDTLRNEAASYPNMQVVVACREFDLENDPRLRRLKKPGSSERVRVELLTNDDVNAALIAAGQTVALTPRQREMLRTPLHLFLFLDASDRDSQTSFGSVSDLFDRYWERKRRAVVARLGHESDWSAVISRICAR